MKPVTIKIPFPFFCVLFGMWFAFALSVMTDSYTNHGVWGIITYTGFLLTCGLLGWWVAGAKP